MKSAPMTIAVIGAAICLSGCTSLFGAKHASRTPADRLDIAEIYHDYAVEQLELGRNQLRAGAYATALETLRRASLDRATAVTAHNAMGVAYAKLGRVELARRHFTLALAREPQNPAIAANLTRLKAETRAAEQALAVVDAAAPVPASASEPSSTVSRPEIGRTIKPAYGARVVAEGGPARLQRVSAHEVRIGGSKIANSPRNVAARPADPSKMVIGSRSGSRPTAKVVHTTYPVRVSLQR